MLVDSLKMGRILGRYDLFAFVIMPNYVHLILRCLGEHVPVVREFKYIHSKPLQPDWNLAECPEEYLWSSACLYLTEGRALIPLSAANELLG